MSACDFLTISRALVDFRMRSRSIFFLVTMLVLSLRVSLADDAMVKDEVGEFYGPFGLNSDGQAHFDALCHGSSFTHASLRITFGEVQERRR